MAKNNYITNTFNKGLYLDANPNSQPDGTYTFAKNAINRDFNQLTDLSNEHSNKECVTFDSQIIGSGYIDEKDKFLIFTRNGLYLVDIKTSSKEFICSDKEFSCDWNLDTCDWITPQFKTIDPCAETFVYWSSGCEYFKVNIDEMLNPVRKQSIKDSIKDTRLQCSDITCEYFKVFKISCQPRLVPVAYSKGGGGLLAGAYQFAIKLKNNEGGETNWYTITSPVYIGGYHNEAGEVTDGLIEINMSNLDCNFDYAELAVIKTIGGIVTTSLVTSFNYTNHVFTYTYIGNDDVPIDIGEILDKGKTYLQGQDLLQYNGNMLYFGIRQTKNLNFQRQVIDNVKTSWIRYRMPYNTVAKYNIKSYMRGETYAFGVKYNSVDGRSSRVFHIPPSCDSGNGGNSSSSSINSTSPTGTIGSHQPGEYNRSRSPKADTVQQPQLDEHDNQLSDNIDALTTTPSDLCTGLSDCEHCAIAGSQCSADTPTVEEVAGDFGGIVSGLSSNEGTDDLTINYSLSTIKEAAQRIIASVKNRERTETIAKQITIDKGDRVSMRGTSESPFEGPYSGHYFDHEGTPQVEIQVDRDIIGCTTVSEEETILYPDTKDCEGLYIYGSLANQKVRHHQVPWTSDVVHFVSNSVGVPSVATPDADEYKDAYIDIIGVQFSNVPIPTEKQLGFKICEDNPYTIVQIPRTSKNKSIHSKGLITPTLLSRNDNKEYLYPTHGLASEDSIVNRYIKIDQDRIDPQASYQQHYNFWSLDTMVKAHALNINQAKIEGIASGIGYRHGQSEIGTEPADTKYGSRIDQRGTRQAINLNKFSRQEDWADINYKIYAYANETISPPEGAPCALMNKYQQESVWFGANFASNSNVLTDKSFKGDALEHHVPISDAKAYYVALVRNLPNQYGDLTNMPYVPILEAGKHTVERIEGMCGDTFIGPHSFVRTSYVSDKVGDFFPIKNMVPSKADRCICDSPEDVIHSWNGKWVPSSLPIDGDAADAKNWAGLHTDTTSHSWAVSNNELPISDFYYNKVVKTLITYWGEFEVNPFMRQRGDLLSQQVYNHIEADYGLDSTVNSNSGNGWDKDFLNQFYWEVEQPSKWKIEKKTLIRTLITTLAPFLGIAELLSPTTAVQFLGELGSAGVLMAIWAVLAKVLFTDKYIDEMLGIPVCRRDEEGGEGDRYLKNFFQNFNKYNRDFSIQNQIEVFYGLPVPYYTCDCDNCEDKTTDEIYISDEQIQGSQVDAYSIVRPRNHVNIPASFGKLTDLFIDSTNLYAHTTDQIIPLRYGRTAVTNDTADIIIGPGPILAKPIGMSEGTSEGFAGLLSRQHAINTQYGRFFIDYKASKIFKFRGSLTDLGGGVYSHLRNKLQYCEEGECANEHINPNDLALGIDPRLERLLLTKRAIDEDQSWTLSYDLLQNQWVSFHSYIPNFYQWDRFNMLSGTDDKLWIHNVKDKFQTFMGKYNPYIIEFIVNDKDILNEIFKSGMLDTFAVKGNLLNREITFNKAWFRNTNQSSNIVELINITTKNLQQENIPLRTEEIPQLRLTRVDGFWSYETPVDVSLDSDIPMFSSNDCSIEIEPINVGEHSDSITFKNNIQLNNYLVIRLIFDNFDDYKLYTRNHSCLTRKLSEFVK